MDTWPAPFRHLVLLTLALGLSWASTDLVPFVSSQPRWGLLVAGVLTALLAYFTPLVNSYGKGKSATN
jgi:hypothetical protein